jgi:ribose-phosphate pyrophosphokinase
MKINKYPDGTSYVSLDVQGREGNTIFKINSYEDLWHLGQFVEAYNFNLGKPSITIPNLIDAQADKRFKENQSSGLKLVCRFLNNMNANFIIFHPHNAEVVEALMDNVDIIDNSEFINTVLFHHTGLDLDSFEDTILMSSDAGGFKPLMKLCDNIGWKGETYSASKARTEDGMKQLIDRADFEGKDILIVDDISVYGGTFKGLSKLLKERNCGKLYLAVSHMTVQNLGEDPVTNYFDKVFTTNSKFDSYGVSNKDSQPDQPKNLEIIKLFNI